MQKPQFRKICAMQPDVEEELKELLCILSLTKREAIALAVRTGVKKKGVGWGKDGNPDNTADAIKAAVVASRFTSHLLMRIAGATCEGEKWCTEDGTEIASAIVARKHHLLLLFHDKCLKAPDTTIVKNIGRIAAVGKRLPPSVLTDSAADIAEKMFNDFSLEDLVVLAKEYGVKRTGIGWGRNSTPNLNKREITNSLIAKESHPRRVASKDDYKKMHHVDPGTDGWRGVYIDTGRDVPDAYMSRQVYRKHLEETVGVYADQHVFHIIASANGGAEHPDNYLGALGDFFNQSIGNTMDYFCCFIAGLDKTELAVRRSLEAEEMFKADPTVNAHVIDKRRHERPCLFSENPYNREAGRCLTGDELVQRGRAAWAHMRLAALKSIDGVEGC